MPRVLDDVRVPGGTALDGRIAVAAVVGCYLAAVAVARVGFDFDLWRWFGVWTHHWPFLDTQNITSAAECWRQGHDVLVDNPCDPYERPVNYPRVWLLLAYLGMDQSWTQPMGLVFAALFFVAAWFLFDRLSLRQAAVVALAVCSPSVMLGVERGQNGLVVFATTVAAVVAWRARRVPRWVGPGVVLVGGVLKLFPVFGLGAFALSRSRRALIASAVAAVVFLLYLAATFDDVRAIGEVLPQHRHFSFGAGIAVTEVALRVAPDLWLSLGVLVKVIAASPLAVAAVVGWVVADRSRLLRSIVPAVGAPADGWRRLAFHLGAFIYIGTFATVSNWDYRLVFLLLCLPQLFEWSGDPDRSRRIIGRVMTAAILVQLWLGPLVGYHSLRDELWSWALALALTVLLVPAAKAAWAARRSVLSARRRAGVA